MSTYTGRTRTDDFRVKDIDALVADLQRHGLDVELNDQVEYDGTIYLAPEPNGSWCLMVQGTNSEPWPMLDASSTAQRLNIDDTEAPEDYTDLADLVAAHLVEGRVVTFTHVGYMGFFDLAGFSIGINSRGERLTVDTSSLDTSSLEG